MHHFNGEKKHIYIFLCINYDFLSYTLIRKFNSTFLTERLSIVFDFQKMFEKIEFIELIKKTFKPTFLIVKKLLF